MWAIMGLESEVAMPEKKMKKTNVPVKIYFPIEDEGFVKKIEKAARKNGLSVSAFCSMALRVGVPMVENSLEVMTVKSKVAADELSKH